MDSHQAVKPTIGNEKFKHNEAVVTIGTANLATNGCANSLDAAGRSSTFLFRHSAKNSWKLNINASIWAGFPLCNLLFRPRRLILELGRRVRHHSSEAHTHML